MEVIVKAIIKLILLNLISVSSMAAMEKQIEDKHSSDVILHLIELYYNNQTNTIEKNDKPEMTKQEDESTQEDFVNQLDKRKRKKGGFKACKYCQQLQFFKNDRQLTEHKKSAHPEIYSHACTYGNCKRTFETFGALKTHQHTHIIAPVQSNSDQPEPTSDNNQSSLLFKDYKPVIKKEKKT